MIQRTAAPKGVVIEPGECPRERAADSISWAEENHDGPGRSPGRTDAQLSRQRESMTTRSGLPRIVRL